MKPAVIFLDWDGTMCGSRFWGHWATDGLHGQANQLIQSRFFAATPGVLEEWMRAEWSTEQVVAEIASRTGLATHDLLTGLRESCERMELFDPKILQVVTDLRKSGIKVVIATDNMDTFTRWTVPALQLASHFDGVINSYNLRALKRDKDAAGKSKFFSDYLTRHNVDPATTILIDDGAHNAVVQDFGIQYQQVTPQVSALNILYNLLRQRSTLSFFGSIQK
jgi:FMN phosphatase YigB (HAD superfamily)